MENTQQPQTQPNQFGGQYMPQRRKTRWWIPVLIICGIVIVFVLMIASFFGSIGSSFSKEQAEVKSNSVLYLDLGVIVQEQTNPNPFSFLGGKKTSSFLDVLTAIKKAKTDDKIEGIFYKASHAAMGFAKAAEIQEALDDFKSSGKWIYAYIETGTKLDYYNALPADKIFMPSEGICELNAMGTSAMFMKGLFDKIGIDFYVMGFEDFKSAGEQLSRKNFSDSAKLQIRLIIEQRYKYFTESIAKHRKIEIEKVKDFLSRGVYTADSLFALGLIDSLCTESDLKDIMKKLSMKGLKDFDAEKSKLRLVGIMDYVMSDPQTKKPDKNNQIAIVYGIGSIVDAGANNPFSNEHMITPKEFIKNLKAAREDKTVKVIILRIDSPGGSVIASDAIWSEVIKTKAVKPVYASMSDVAASGGYYIPMACDTIIAHAATITGSIGVIMAIPNMTELFDKIGITSDTISVGGSSAQFGNPFYPMRTQDKEVLYNLGKNIYFRFVNKVATSRHKTFDETRALAKGRVWTGEDAMKHGLVDVLGGLNKSISIAKRRMGVADSVKVYVQLFPKPVDDFASFLKMFGLDEEGEESCKVDFGMVFSKLFNINKSDMVTTYNSLPATVKNQMNYFMNLLGISSKEHYMMAMPYYFD